jgi:hypothetical protein
MTESVEVASFYPYLRPCSLGIRIMLTTLTRRFQIHNSQVCDKGAGSALLLKPKRMEEIARAADMSMSM